MTENISKLRIEGGTPLVGEVHVRGAKNLVPKAMAQHCTVRPPRPCVTSLT